MKYNSFETQERYLRVRDLEVTTRRTLLLQVHVRCLGFHDLASTLFALLSLGIGVLLLRYLHVDVAPLGKDLFEGLGDSLLGPSLEGWVHKDFEMPHLTFHHHVQQSSNTNVVTKRKGPE